MLNAICRFWFYRTVFQIALCLFLTNDLYYFIAGKIAGELKEVPKEFQKGLEEGEKLAKQSKKEIAAEISKSDD